MSMSTGTLIMASIYFVEEVESSVRRKKLVKTRTVAILRDTLEKLWSNWWKTMKITNEVEEYRLSSIHQVGITQYTFSKLKNFVNTSYNIFLGISGFDFNGVFQLEVIRRIWTVYRRGYACVILQMFGMLCVLMLPR